MLSQTLQRRDGRGENRIDIRTPLLPIRIDSGYREVGLGVEEVIEASLFYTSFLADLVDRGAAIRADPDQLQHSLHQSLFSITDASHDLFFLRCLYHADMYIQVD